MLAAPGETCRVFLRWPYHEIYIMEGGYEIFEAQTLYGNIGPNCFSSMG